MAKRQDYFIGALIGVSVFIFVLIIFILLGALARGGLVPTGLGKKVALVELTGPIKSSKSVVSQLERYREDDSVPAIVLRIESPGGGVTAAQEIYQGIKRVRQAGKKVIVSMGSVAASGGYYVACAADTIVANPGTITGSIGVVFQLPNVRELLRKVGVEVEVIKRGEYKDIGSPIRGITEKERKLLQEIIDDAFEQFVEVVAKERGLPREKVLRLADGRIFTGRQAKELGLVDFIGDYQSAINLAAQMVGIKGKPRTIMERKRVSLLDLLFQKVEGALPRTDLPSLEYRLLL